MAFLVGSINVEVYTDSAQTDFPKQLFPSNQTSFSSVVITGVQSTTIPLTASGSQTINLNGMSGVKRLYLFSDTTNVNVNINALGNILLQASEPGYMPFTVTSLTLTNASGTTATNVTVTLISS